MARRGRRRKGEPPPYLEHASGQAYCVVDGRKRYLGVHGSPESYERYESILREWRSAEQRRRANDPVMVPGNDCSIAELVQYACGVADKRYRTEEEPNHGEHIDFRRALTPLMDLMGERPARSFTPRDMKRVRQVWIDSGVGRKGINQYTGRLRRAFRWGVAEDMVPPSVLTALEAVEDVRASEIGREDPPPISDASWEMVEAVLPFLCRQLRTMVLLQWHMGMRPGEVCRMRGREIAQDGRVEWKGKWFSAQGWVFMPDRHKNKKRGKFLAYVLSPTAKELLTPWLRDDPDELLFQPREADAERRVLMREKRKTPLTPSQQYRRKPDPKRKPGAAYQVTSYIHAVHKACARAFPPSGDLARTKDESLREWKARLTAEQKTQLRAWEKANRFSPNQLRHAFCTRIEREHGLVDAAKMVGHAHIATTEIYVARDLKRASEIAALLG